MIQRVWRVAIILGLVAGIAAFGTTGKALAVQTVLFNQTGGVSAPNSGNVTCCTNSQLQVSPYTNYTDNAADHFAVPAATSWTVSGVDSPGAYAFGTSATGVTVTFYSDNGGVPGTVQSSQVVSNPGGLATGSFTITLGTPVVLGTGTYWVSVQANGSNFRWYWDDTATGTGNPAAWQQPGNGDGRNCTTWGDRSACVGDAGNPNQAFTLLGTSTSTGPVTRYVANTGTDTNNDCTVQSNPCLTIGHAVSVANAGDTIDVAAGTYTESVIINKTLTIDGAQAGVKALGRTGPETIMNDTNYDFTVAADNVTIDGFTFEGAQNGNFGYAVDVDRFHSGASVNNNIFQDNQIALYLDSTGVNPTTVEGNLFTNNNISGPAGGNAIYSDQGLANAQILSNTFTNNTNAAINIGSDFIGVPDTNIVIHYNRIVGNADGLIVGSHATNVDATLNWWGCNTGPNTTGCDSTVNLGGTFTVNPWLVMSVYSSSPSIASGESATVTADLRCTNTNPNGPCTGTGVPDGTPVLFTVTSPDSTAVFCDPGTTRSTVTTGGFATVAVCSDASSPSSATVCATVDNQTNCVTITVTVGNHGPPVNPSISAQYRDPEHSLTFSVAETSNPSFPYSGVFSYHDYSADYTIPNCVTFHTGQHPNCGLVIDSFACTSATTGTVNGHFYTQGTGGPSVSFTASASGGAGSYQTGNFTFSTSNGYSASLAARVKLTCPMSNIT